MSAHFLTMRKPTQWDKLTRQLLKEVVPRDMEGQFELILLETDNFTTSHFFETVTKPRVMGQPSTIQIRVLPTNKAIIYRVLKLHLLRHRYDVVSVTYLVGRGGGDAQLTGQEIVQETTEKIIQNPSIRPRWGVTELVIIAKVSREKVVILGLVYNQDFYYCCLLFHLHALVVETTLYASPTGLCGMVPYRVFPTDSPDEMSSPEYISSLPAISPFLCTDSSEALDSSNGPPSQDLYVATVARWRSMIRRRSAILIRLGEAILFGRPYRTHLNGPLKLLTARKRVGPLLARKLGYRHVSPQSSSGDSSERPSYSSSPSAGPSRKRCRSPVDSVPSSTPVIGSLAPTRADLLPPRKRFRDSYSSKASIEEDTEIDPIETEIDMELGIGDGDDVRDHDEIYPRDVRDDTEEYEADTSARDTVEVGIDPMSAPIVEEEIVEPSGKDSSNSFGTRDGIVRSVEDMPIDLNDVVRDFYHHMSEVRIDRIVRIETVQRRLEADQLIAKGQRVIMIEMIDSLRLENLKVHAMLDIERVRVNSLRLYMSLSQEEFCQALRDRDDT
ncbi:hypothetical protein Tco_1313471 [Tanacetum coccineum]